MRSHFRATQAQVDVMQKFLRQCVADLPSELPEPSLSVHAERHRIMPHGTPRPGRLDFDYTPNHREPLNEMSPHSNTQRVRVMKGVQGGWSMVAECILGYYMLEAPADILFMSATEGLLERWASRRMEPMIDSYGIRRHIHTIADLGAKTRKTGDKTYSKEYFGCRLDMASARSSAAQSATDKRILVRDEMDRSPVLLTTGEGNWVFVSESRTDGWGSRRKIFDFSTPTTHESSMINQLYLEGDQRKYLVPCPKCGHKQELVWGNDDTQYGMKAETEAGRLVRGYYSCDKCHDAIFNHEKTIMLSGGHWEPTAVSIDKYTKSYHDSQMYRPVGMFDWTAMVADHIKSKGDPDKMRSFVNLRLGLPYKEEGSRPKLVVVEARGGYKSHTVPDGVLFITAAVDVQTGSATDKKNPARLEMEICGHGDNFRTWSIAYHVFEGEIEDIEGGAWKMLTDFRDEGGFDISRGDGRVFSTVLKLIDSGDGNTRDTVYDYCKLMGDNFYPSKGFSSFKRKKGERTPDEETASDALKYRLKAIDEDLVLYEIATNYYKKNIYRNLKIARQATGPQKAGFSDFPMDYGAKYFKMLTAEEQLQDGSFDSGGRRNESLDCRVYNLAAAHVYLNAVVQDLRLTAKGLARQKKQTIGTMELQKFNHRFALSKMTELTKRQSPGEVDDTEGAG